MITKEIILDKMNEHVEECEANGFKVDELMVRLLVDDQIASELVIEKGMGLVEAASFMAGMCVGLDIAKDQAARSLEDELEEIKDES